MFERSSISNIDELKKENTSLKNKIMRLEDEYKELNERNLKLLDSSKNYEIENKKLKEENEELKKLKNGIDETNGFLKKMKIDLIQELKAKANQEDSNLLLIRTNEEKNIENRKILIENNNLKSRIERIEITKRELEDKLRVYTTVPIYFINMEANSYYSDFNKLENINRLSDLTRLNGICTNKPGKIIFEMMRIVEFNSIDIGCYSNNNWGSRYLNGTSIMVSNDKLNWILIGNCGNNTQVINRVNVAKSRAKYIKLESTNYIGLGYFKIISID